LNRTHHQGTLVNIEELIDESAATALAHAATLQEHLRHSALNSALNSAQLDLCATEMRVLICDIEALRNATELLKRASTAR